MWRAFRLAILFVVLAGLSFTVWLGWLHRPFEREDWRQFAGELKERGACQELRHLLSVARNAGETDASLYEIGLAAEGHKCWTANSKKRQDPSAQLNHIKVTNKAAIARSEGGASRRPKRRQETFQRWRPRNAIKSTIAFALSFPSNPVLVWRHTGARLVCSNGDVIGFPQNTARLNLNARRTRPNHNTLASTRLDKHRAWCGKQLFRIAHAMTSSTEPNLPDGMRRQFLSDAHMFGSGDASFALMLNYAQKEDGPQLAALMVDIYGYRRGHAPSLAYIAKKRADIAANSAYAKTGQAGASRKEYHAFQSAHSNAAYYAILATEAGGNQLGLCNQMVRQLDDDRIASLNRRLDRTRRDAVGFYYLPEPWIPEESSLMHEAGVIRLRPRKTGAPDFRRRCSRAPLAGPQSEGV